ncbi:MULTISPECIES: DegQ family serine endoprotease [unclassified Polaromonas]|uniref:DegQ family serine endoprotease n=1 Tax=unclassified Polaromonas TaxID=2638319 RepID=UPI0018C9FD5D|nr:MULTISPECIES: DegQ family serine endoprotease [unclassified Polaromonas]MBG6070533.1 serine protease Do [Polaromonas sp. CG_9.7]MBG6112531.1 serine protease Do [Polaromonas sp. CG_9.2]MDH6184181.1 serine protease Do [Polaromonas sp. CG_23.6]
MRELNLKPLRPYLAACLMALAATSSVLPLTPVWAQTRTLPDFTDLVDEVGPSVVNIRTLERAKASATTSGIDEQMLEFFKRFGIPVPPNMPRGPRAEPGQPGQPDENQPRGVGSGFILTADGYVMTNAHVVDGADEVLVTLTDKREFKAKIIGADKRTDVAVVKIEATGLPAVKIGDISRLRVGEWVMAIGSPFGLENTVTAGIVSAKQRDTGDYLPFIQTDVAINPGNSGGPLINMRGEVVGINSQIYSRSGGFQGISFSIPIDEATRVSEQLRINGKVTRGRIGVQIDQVTKDVAEAIGLGKVQGALVRGVESGAPAEKAGIEAGDIITKFEGKSIDKASDLPRMVGSIKPGTQVTVTVFRRGASKDLSVTIAEVDADKPVRAAAKSESKPPVAGPAQAVGLSVSEITEAQKKDLNVKGGVKIDVADGAAARAGLREGDVIVSIANAEVTGVKGFEAALSKIDKTKNITMLVRRGELAQFVIIRPAR